jgi:hypothetical protein
MKGSKALRFFIAFTLLLTQYNLNPAYALSESPSAPLLVKVEAPSIERGMTKEEASPSEKEALIPSVREIFALLQKLVPQGPVRFQGLSGQIKISVWNGDYYVIDAERSRVVEMGVGRKPYAIDYLYDASHNELVRIRTRAEGSETLEAYETYARTPEGELLGLVETGIYTQGLWIVQKSFDRSRGLMTLHDFEHPGARAVYSLKTPDSNEPFRMIRYESDSLSLEIRYDDRARTQTVLDLLAGTYEIYELLPGNETGRLLELGRMDGREKQLVELFNLQRGADSIPTYVFTREADPDYLTVFERLPEGGIGRLLWYRGKDAEGRPIDQEFYYERNETAGEETVIILDHMKASFLRFILAQGRTEEGVVGPVDRDRNRAESSDAGILTQGKKMRAGGASAWSEPETETRLYLSEEERPRFREKWEPWVRGPPEREESNASSDARLSSSGRRGTAFLAEALLSEFQTNRFLNSFAFYFAGKGCVFTGLIKANQKSTQSKGGY